METIAILPTIKPINAEIRIPGSKSFTNRALILSSMTKSKVKIINPLFCDDTRAMIQCLKKLGIKIKTSKETIDVIGSIDDIKDGKFELDADLSGTTLRFLLPLLTIAPGVKILKGKDGLNKRPIKILVDALVQLGAKIKYLDNDNFPPILINSSKLKGGLVTLNGDISSQYISSLLMIGPFLNELTIKVTGIQISKPYIDMTIDIMKKFGVQVVNDRYKKYIVPNGETYHANEYRVEGDYSSAGYFLAVAALTKSTLTLKNLNPDSFQADKKILNVLESMGNKIKFGKNEITIKGNAVKPIVLDVLDFPDQVQTLSVLAAFAKGKTKLKGIQSLRIKETDRILALQCELKKMDIKTNATRTSLTIFGGDPKPSIIDTYGDHRMAMSFTIAGSKLQGVILKDPKVVSKTFPDFFEKLKSIGIGAKTNHQIKKIVLVGFMGAGKTSIAPLLSKSIGSNCIEMDDLILKKSHENSIADIFEKFGEAHFRSLEQKVAEMLVDKKNIVISAGGGVVMNKKTIDTLSKNSIVVFLSTKFKTLQKRLKGAKDRPLWNDINKARNLFELRQPLYKKAADIIIQTDNKSVTNIVKEIIERV